MRPTRRRLASLGAASLWAAALIAAAPAQQPDRAPRRGPVLLAGQQLVDANSGDVRGTLGIKDYPGHAAPLSNGVFALDGRLVDVQRMQVLELQGGAFALRDVASGPVWTQPAAKVHAAAGASLAQRLLTGDRVVLARSDGGLVGLDRKDGSVAWERAAVPNEALRADNDLVLAAGTVGGKPMLFGLSLQNGAAAFHAELRGPAKQIVPTPLGIAVLGDGWWQVFDRAGPKVLEQGETLGALAGTADGWFALQGTRIRALRRDGSERWNQDLGAADFMDQRQLFATPGGDLLVLAHCRMADSGMALELHANRDGVLLWRRSVEGLGVAHSKYRHDAYVQFDGERAFACSQGSAGSFFVALDLASGEQLDRHRQKDQ
jgi:outer membrane protein assembly factor BamB